MKSKFVTAKELATELERSEKWFRIKRNQQAIGIDTAIDLTYLKPIRFYKEKVREALRKLGHEASSF